MNLVPFFKSLSFVFFSSLQIHPFVLSVTSRGHSRIVRMSQVLSPVGTAFVLLLGGKSHFVSWRVLWLNCLPKSECRVLNKSIMDSLCTLDRAFVRRSLLANTVVEIHTRQKQYHVVNLDHYISEIDAFSGKTTV